MRNQALFEDGAAGRGFDRVIIGQNLFEVLPAKAVLWSGIRRELESIEIEAVASIDSEPVFTSFRHYTALGDAD